ncbi:MAG: sugar phosphate nucleotidyltransferase [Candidatus Peregrinibacteria bacterium]|nr:sugar phosphate nucleotidyltransferase [Candidatus Peregrinibacteria bacterium]MDZ4244764.1 sugar phosphate nucleotidyltransferase [Candidatus Gracilibacteria bacterium]
MIKKAIIPVAGLATRFLPASKVVPKTMFPIGDKPIIHMLVEEAVKAGIEEIAIVVSDRQEIIKEYFKPDEILEKELSDRGRTEKYKLLSDIHKMAKIHFFTQEKMLGDGHALLATKNFIKEGESCLVLFGDELIGNDGPNAAQQLINYYNDVQAPIVGVHLINEEEIEKYGIVETNEKGQIQTMVEKPKMEETNSRLAIIGKYIINREVLDCIKNSNPGKPDGELRLIDGLKTYNNGINTYAVTLDGQRFDTGNHLGLLEANIYFGLKDKTVNTNLKKYLQTVEKL